MRAALDDADILEGTVQFVLLAVLPDVVSHPILQINRNSVLRDVQVSNVGFRQLVAEVVPARGGHLVRFSNIQTPDLLFLQ